MSARRRHRMPFGATLIDDGVLFRLWAPAAKSVDLRLNRSGRVKPMNRCADGWFDLAVRGAKAGDLYQFMIDGRQAVPDPSSRFQPQDVNGPSEVIDAEAFAWDDDDWLGRPWHEVVLYEIHVGTFSRAGTFDGVKGELDRLARLGVTAIELMPLADFAGTRNWGYDGVLPFAPDSSYGRPEHLKALICEAHRRGLMVFLDVVYNHFGPEGNYLALYAPAFFSTDQTDWGQAIDFVGKARDFFIHNALYWLEEYHIDGLRLDAVHAIKDDQSPHFLDDLATSVRTQFGSRSIHLVLENDKNEAHYVERNPSGSPRFYDAQWNDDFHHAMHVILTGETEGYYSDYAADPVDKLGRALTQGFVYQGEHSSYRGVKRGEPSAHLPPLSFVNFIQNHDQIGNRACGERLTQLASREALAAAAAILLLAPSPPLLFMGEEAGAEEPFLFFCDFTGSLADAVRVGRRKEFARFPAFASEEARMKIPDPLSLETFQRSHIERAVQAPLGEVEMLYKDLLAIRRREIIPRLQGAQTFAATYETRDAMLSATWHLPESSILALDANLSNLPASALRIPGGRRLWGSEDLHQALPPWTVAWVLESRS